MSKPTRHDHDGPRDEITKLRAIGLYAALAASDQGAAIQAVLSAPCQECLTRAVAALELSQGDGEMPLTAPEDDVARTFARVYALIAGAESWAVVTGDGREVGHGSVRRTS
jgi:hypothetical protein